jgi:transcriptional regulator with XRE-family HTH domain
VKTTHIEPYVGFLKRLARSRKAAKVTQGELARRLGKTQSFVSKVEAGERRLDLVEFIYWSKALGLEPAELLARLAEEIEPLRRSRPRRRVVAIPRT